VRVLFRRPRRDMSRAVRPSFGDSRFVLLPLGGLTLATLGVGAGAPTLTGVALAAGLIGLAVVTVHPPRAFTTPVIESGDRTE